MEKKNNKKKYLFNEAKREVIKYKEENPKKKHKVYLPKNLT